MSLEDFNSKYPKEKILKLKKYTDTNRQLNESELYDSINDRIEHACDLLNSIKKEHWECKNVLNVYEKLSKEVRSEFALGDNLSASNGYKAYQKIRNIERNILRLKAEESVLRSFCDKYRSIDSSLNKLKTGLKQKQHSRTNSHYRPLLELDIREQIEKELESNEY